MRRRVWIILLVVDTTACDALIISTEYRLPERVIIKSAKGVPTNYMSHDQRLAAAILMTTLIGLLPGGVGALVVRRFPRFLHHSIPQLPESGRFRLIHKAQAASLMLGARGAVWSTWFHGRILNANRSSLPQLDSAPVLRWRSGNARYGGALGIRILGHA